MGTYETFDEQKQFACRVIADHARATAFAIADGILPGNEGRNYVLRKIMRRAIYHGREHLGFQDLFFHKVCDFVIDKMKDAFPELEIQRDFIGKMVRLEEERFGNTLTVGLNKFNSEYSDIFSIKERIAKLIWTLPLIADYEQIDKWKTDIKESNLSQELAKQKNFNEELAKLTLKYRIPPYLIEAHMDSRFQNEEIFEQEKHYNNHLYKDYIWILVRDSGTDEERANLLSFTKYDDKSSEKFLRWLDVFFDGTDDNKLENYKYKKFAQLYDTYGLTPDLIRVKLEEAGLSIPENQFEEAFNIALDELQKQSAVGKTQQAEKINPIYADLQNLGVKSNFHGYDKTEVEGAKVLALVKNDERVDVLNEGDEGLIVLDETPFYAEAGGQVGDVGIVSGKQLTVSSENGETAHGSPLTARVLDTFAPIAGIVLHKSKIEKGSIRVGDEITAAVDVQKRDATRRNHTATHLVHAALKEVLGTHVKQAGSVVAPNYLRFDFTHYQPITDAELTEIEDLVNRYILENQPVNTNVMAIEDAMRSGAVALFGEKYGSAVRVLSVGGGEFSKELCGGTHVKATGDIGSFKIISDEAIASGVRRIRAITGFDAFERFREDEKLIAEAVQIAKAQRDNLPNAIEKLQEELKRVRRENDELKMKIATGAIGSASSNGDEAKDINGVKVIAKTVEGLDKGGMRHLSDTLMAKLKSGVVILGRTEDEKVSFIVRVSDDLTDKIKAGKIVQEIAPIVSGRGGGKPDMAEGGGTDASKLNDALQASYTVIENLVKE